MAEPLVLKWFGIFLYKSVMGVTGYTGYTWLSRQIVTLSTGETSLATTPLTFSIKSLFAGNTTSDNLSATGIGFQFEPNNMSQGGSFTIVGNAYHKAEYATCAFTTTSIIYWKYTKLSTSISFALYNNTGLTLQS